VRNGRPSLPSVSNDRLSTGDRPQLTGARPEWPGRAGGRVPASGSPVRCGSKSRFVGRLDAQNVVQIGFVGRQDQVDLRVLQIEPGDIARVIIVVEQGFGAGSKKSRKGDIGTEIRGVPQ